MCSFQGTGDNSRFSHLWIRTQSVLITDILRISFLEKKYRLSQINLHRRFFFSIKAALKLSNGDKEIRTPDPLLARQVLSQLSYTPIVTTICNLVINGLKWTRTIDLTLIRRAL